MAATSGAHSKRPLLAGRLRNHSTAGTGPGRNTIASAARLARNASFMPCSIDARAKARSAATTAAGAATRSAARATGAPAYEADATSAAATGATQIRMGRAPRTLGRGGRVNVAARRTNMQPAPAPPERRDQAGVIVARRARAEVLVAPRLWRIH